MRPSGELDLSTASAVESALPAHARLDTDLILDISGLRFCDCRGLGALQRVANCYRDDGRQFSLAAPAGIVARVLAVAAECMTITVCASVTR